MNTLSPSLAICIPTYNRPASIKNRLNDVHLLKERVSLWISDNSDNSQTRDIVENDTYHDIKYHKNAFNIGGGANFISSLQLDYSEYVWLRGDDDTISQVQLVAVKKAIKNQPDVVVLSRHCKKPYLITSTRDFFLHFHLTQAAGWLSMVVFKQRSLKYGLKWGYWGISNGWPHFSLILGILRDKPNPSCLVYPVSLQSSDFRENGRKSRTWSFLKTCIENFPTNFNIIPSASERKYAFSVWRSVQTRQILKTFYRAKIGLAPPEHLSVTCLCNLFSIHKPNTWFICFALIALNLAPSTLLRVVFVIYSYSLSCEKLTSLEIPELYTLSFASRYQHIIRASKDKKFASDPPAFI